MFNRINKLKSQKGFTLIELLIVIAIIGIIAALLIPNFLDSLQKAKQKRTEADIRNTGTAWMSWLTDQAGAAAAAGAATTYTMPTASDFATVQGLLEPQYIQGVLENDAWNNPLIYCHEDPATILTFENAIAIGSPGRDGTETASCGADVDIMAFDPTDYDQDIVWADGYFVRWPQKIDAGT